jgi:predicted nucleic acid-binding protein
MKPRVYIETTIVSYLTARVARDVVSLARQKLTRHWWENRAVAFDLVTSRLTELESARGDAGAARGRLLVVRELTFLPTDDRVAVLAQQLIGPGAIPAKATEDAVHLATCAVNTVPYLLTWNFRHLANVNIRLRLDFICAAAGYRLPQICTPEEL